MKKGDKINVLFLSLCSLGVNKEIYLDDFEAIVDGLTTEEQQALFHKIYDKGYSVRRDVNVGSAYKIKDYLMSNPYRVDSEIELESFKYRLMTDDQTEEIITFIKSPSLDEVNRVNIVKRLNVRYLRYIYDAYKDNDVKYHSPEEAESETIKNIDYINRESLRLIFKHKKKIKKEYKYKLIIDEAMKKHDDQNGKKCCQKRKRL